MSQEAFSDQGRPAVTGPCAWCGEATRLKLAIEKARYSALGGVRRVVKPAKEVWCCQAHQQTLQLRGDDA